MDGVRFENQRGRHETTMTEKKKKREEIWKLTVLITSANESNHVTEQVSLVYGKHATHAVAGFFDLYRVLHVKPSTALCDLQITYKLPAS